MKIEVALALKHRCAGEVVREESVDYYRSLKVPELKSEIELMIKSVEGGLGRVNKIMRGKVIAALEILRQRVHHGEWQKFLRGHRLNPATVRSWRARGRGDMLRLRQILGESSCPREPKRKEPTSESAAVQLAKAGKRLAESVVRGNIQYATNLAKDYLEAYDQVA